MEKYIKNPFVRLGEINGQNYLINGRQCFEVNEIGKAIWENFETSITEDAVYKKITEEYEINNEKKATKEIENFIGVLIKHELVVIADEE